MKINLSKYQSIFLAIIFISITITYFILGAGINLPNRQAAANIEQTLAQDKTVVEGILKDLQELLLTNGEKALLYKAIEYQNKYDSRFAFALYKSGELKSWTNNHIAFPSHLSDLKYNQLQKLGSAQVINNQQSFIHFTLVGAQIVGNQYPWENEFLQSGLASYFQIPGEVHITETQGQAVNDSSGKCLFYVEPAQGQPFKSKNFWTFFLFLGSVYFLSLWLTSLLKPRSSKKIYRKLFIFLLAMVGWYLLHFLFKTPMLLFQNQIFSPLTYALYSHDINLGNIVVWSWILLIITIFYVRHIPISRPRYWMMIIYVSILFMVYYGIIYLVESLVFDSQIVFNLYEPASLNLLSFMVLGVIFILFLVWILVANRWIGQFTVIRKASQIFWTLMVFGFLLAPALFDLDSDRFWLIQLTFNGVLILVFYLQKSSRNQRFLWEALAYLALMTISLTLLMNQLIDVREKRIRETAALKLNLINDPLLEEHFISSIPALQKDEKLLALTKGENAEMPDDSLVQHITSKYFRSFLHQYNVNLIHCNQESVITVLPDNFETSCYAYFDHRADSALVTIKPDTLFLLESSFQYHNYVGRISLNDREGNTSSIFIEFVTKLKSKEKGLPALLEKNAGAESNLKRNCSWASYSDGVLAERFGKFDYKQKFKDYNFPQSTNDFTEYNNYNHYIFSVSRESAFILSLENPNLLQKLSSFAFIMLYFSLLAFVFYALFNLQALLLSISNFQGRLQYSMILLLLFSFILIGISSLYYIRYLNQTKNYDNLMEKAHSVLIELEHKLGGKKQFTPDDLLMIEGLLFKFSDVFFTDIILYNQKGEMIASSRPEIFETGLLAERMNAEAYYDLSALKNSFFIQEESIGSQKYLSAYLPFQNQGNMAFAYLNLPYFTKQYELENEFSGFIVTFLNIYIFLLIIAITTTVLISRYLSKPLKMIKEKIKQLNLQNQNEKIEWNKQDEIGELIKEYNRMVDELSRSAQELALNQRESAWREMAQQIAHEIKNPLTPMKLNVQYLVKAWDDKVDDYEWRMKKIARGLEEQIDVLTQISGQFSTFAAIDRIQPELLPLQSVINDVEFIFHNEGSIVFIQDFPSKDILVLADKSQIIRVFNNLYKNAVQAISPDQKGEIISKITISGPDVEISITDNGCGMADDALLRIFEPRFTTKTGGMGLGLALVKKMLENANSKISVQSIKGSGTTFTIKLPMAK